MLSDPDPEVQALASEEEARSLRQLGRLEQQLRLQLLPKDPDDGSTWEAAHWEPESEGGPEPSGEWMPEDQFPDWTVIYLADDLPSGRRR